MISFSRLSRSTAGIAVAAIGLAAVALFFAPKAHALTALSAISDGDLIRGESLSAVYYMGADGFRYVFPNDKTYFTWYTNFDSVKWISDADMAKIQIGGNVTYHPGSKMIKITSDSKTYMVAHGGELQWVPDEATAVSLYGSDWNTKIDDVADSFFSNYTMGTTVDLGANGSLTASHEFDGTSSIDDDKELTAPSEISVEDDVFSVTTSRISVGETVRFTNNASTSHTILADDNSWGNILASGGLFVKRFNTAGTYTYYDATSGATGAIIVE